MQPGNWKTYNEYYNRASQRQQKPPRLDGFFSRRWKALVAAGVGLVLFLALIVFAGVAANRWEEQADPGVVACQNMADGVNSGDTKDDTSTPMTEGSFNKAKQVWQHSHYAELRVAGVNVVTTIYTLDIESSKSDDDTNVGYITELLNRLRDQWTALQVVCAQHGVDIPALPWG